MARIVLGNRDGAFALARARAILADLTEEWPDLNLVQRTVPSSSAGESADRGLLQALLEGHLNIALQRTEFLLSDLPEGLVLAAVTKRLEPRCALVAKGRKSLLELPRDAAVGVLSERDRAFLAAGHDGFEIALLGGQLNSDLARLTAGEFEALLLPVAVLHALDRRQWIDAYLDAAEFTPAAGQGSVGLIVREDDDLAFEVAYSLQHRPSLDRVTAELSFARELPNYFCGALATVSEDGELTLFGSIVSGNTTIQASTVGDAREASELGVELARDVLERFPEVPRERRANVQG